jgi:hypothetical protein
MKEESSASSGGDVEMTIAAKAAATARRKAAAVIPYKSTAKKSRAGNTTLGSAAARSSTAGAKKEATRSTAMTVYKSKVNVGQFACLNKKDGNQVSGFGTHICANVDECNNSCPSCTNHAGKFAGNVGLFSCIFCWECHDKGLYNCHLINRCPKGPGSVNAFGNQRIKNVAKSGSALSRRREPPWRRPRLTASARHALPWRPPTSVPR